MKEILPINIIQIQNKSAMISSKSVMSNLVASPHVATGDLVKTIVQNGFPMINKVHISQIVAIVATRECGWTSLI